MLKRVLLIISFAIITLLIGCNSKKDSKGEYFMEDETKWDTYSDTWVATDELGRTIPGYEEVGPKREDKFVGVFYHLWHHNTFYANGVGGWKQKTSDVTRILKEDPSALDNGRSPLWMSSTPFYWAKPIFGYYDLQYDDYVLRKHAQMLSDIGVDVIIIDMTNCAEDSPLFYDWDSLMNLCKVFTEIREEGGKTSQFTWLLRWNDLGGEYAIRKLFEDLYSKNLYSDLWFKWEGKPLLIGDKGSLDQEKEKHIVDFFTWRSAHPEYTAPDVENDWAWNSIYPQSAAYTSDNKREEVAVGVAQNWTTGLAFFSSRDTDGNFIARGRSYRNGQQPLYKDPLSDQYPSKYGYNFEEGLDRALEIDPNFIFVTAWNEWIMGRFNPKGVPSWAMQHNQPDGGAFCDAFTPEFSRDIEPTLDGDLGDNFYYQLAIAIRKFKGVRRPVTAEPKDIQIDGNFDDWNDVKPEFRDDINDKAVRNSKSLERNVTYINETGRNDFKLMKVSTDKQNVYFYVETVDDITSYTDSNWMRLFIKINEADPNWQGYNYILNRQGVQIETTTLEKSTGGWNWDIVDDDIKYKVFGNKMEVAIPKDYLGLKGDKIDIQFKWNDNMQNQGDIYDFMLNGDTAPNNRFNYRYTNKDLSPEFTRSLYSISGTEDNKLVSKNKSVAIRFDAEQSFDKLEVFLSALSWKRVDDINTDISYNGTWGAVEGSGYYDSTIHFSNVVDSSVSFTFNGTGVRWIGDKASDRGIVNVFIDGTSVGSVDTYSAQSLKQQILYEITGLENKKHEIKIVITSDRGNDSSDIYQSVDCFEYLPAQNADDVSFKYSIYSWKSDYKKTTSRKAVATGTIKRAEINKWVNLNIDKLSKGDYLLVLKCTKGTFAIGSYDANYSDVVMYVDGKVKEGCLMTRINYVM